MTERESALNTVSQQQGKKGLSEASERRSAIDDLLSGTFNSILRIEERSLDNRLR